MPPSKPIVNPTWAGNFDCLGPCRRKRLLGSEFSNRNLERHRKEGAALTCKQCQAQKETDERLASQKRAEAKAAQCGDGAASASEPVACTSCKKSLPPTSFNRNQLSKGPGKARCRACVDKAVQAEENQSGAAKEKRMEDARKAVADAERRGDVAAKVVAESVVAALEAEIVTGLKPVKLGKGRGRGGRWGGGRGRGGGRGSVS